MEMLKDVLANPAPSSQAVSSGRRELQQLIRRRARARRTGWRLAGLGLTTAAAAGAIMAAAVIISGTAHPVPGVSARTATTGHHRPAVALSARQVLLAAAASAEQTPAASGAYWYVRTRAATGDGNQLHLAETWTKRDGETWIRDLKAGGPIKLPPNAAGPFFLGGQELTLSQIEALPTQPAPLTRWIITNAAQHSSKSGGPASSKAREREDIFESLVWLLSQLPSPPPLRAAAFRALAALPGVTSLGALDGGQGLRYTTLGGEKATLIIDPSTGRIQATNFFVDNEGATFWQPIPNATITGRWTNTLPRHHQRPPATRSPAPPSPTPTP
jgi:hypothetical protein